MNPRVLFKAGMEWCAIVLLVVMALPAVAVVLFVLRFAALAIAALAVAVALGAYCLSPPFRRRAREALAGEGEGGANQH